MTELTNEAKLYAKLLKAKQNFDKILKDKENPFFKSKYSDLNSLLAATEPALNNVGLLLLQPCGGNRVSTIIVDTETGFNVQSFLDIPSTITDPQKIVAATTYLRRATLQCLLGIVGDDDDGNSLRETSSKETKVYGKPASAPAIPEGEGFQPPKTRSFGKPKTMTNGTGKSSSGSGMTADDI